MQLYILNQEPYLYYIRMCLYPYIVSLFLVIHIMITAHISSFSLPTLYPSSRSSSCIIFFIKFQKKKKDPCKNMGKNIKSYATTQVHFPREREGSLMAKSPNLSFKIWYGLTVHIIRF